MQGDPLSPTIFNVVVDAVVRHWLEGLQNATEEKGATGGEGHFSAVFYADDGMVGESDPAWLQGAFSALEPGGVRRADHPVVGVKHR